MAEDLQDVSLMARIEGGYLIVLEAKISLVKLRNQHRLMREIQCSSKSHKESKAKANVESWGTFYCNSLNCVLFMNICLTDFGICEEIHLRRKFCRIFLKLNLNSE